MMSLENKCIIINDARYEIIETINYNNKFFVYLVNQDDELDSMFKELVLDNNMYITLDIDNELFKSILLNLFIEKFKKY